MSCGRVAPLTLLMLRFTVIVTTGIGMRHLWMPAHKERKKAIDSEGTLMYSVHPTKEDRAA